MSLNNILDGKTIAMGALASLVGYVFYGFINLQAKVDTIDTKQVQVQGEQRDLWGKYNEDMDDKIDFMKDYYEFKVDNESRWTQYWKERYEENKK
jgi:hypothetical protein